MDSFFDGDDLSTALGTEGREMVPEGFDNARDSIPIEVVGGRRFLKSIKPPICAPDQRYRRSGSTVSSIAHSIIGCMANIGAVSTVSSAHHTGEERTGWRRLSV